LFSFIKDNSLFYEMKSCTVVFIAYTKLSNNYTENGMNLYTFISWQKAIGSWQVLLPTVFFARDQLNVE